MRVKELSKAAKRGEKVIGSRIVGGIGKCQVIYHIGTPERSKIENYSGQRMWRVDGHPFSRL